MSVWLPLRWSNSRLRWSNSRPPLVKPRAGVVKLGDFGLARYAAEEQTGTALRHSYSAPTALLRGV
eukprot:3931990-Rhodomonas_salina.1